nr:hypothetical protein GCM10025730_32750 [Promicromonospora thailandica]
MPTGGGHDQGAGRERGRRERGEINILAAGMVPALIIAIGLVVDGGGRLHAEDEAEYAADQAARAAAQQIRIDRAQLGLPPRWIRAARRRPPRRRSARWACRAA